MRLIRAWLALAAAWAQRKWLERMRARPVRTFINDRPVNSYELSPESDTTHAGRAE